MITWIQKTFHEHFRIVFIALIVASTVAFIFTNNASPGFGLFQSRAEKRPFFGINLAGDKAFERMQKDTIVSVFLQFGSTPTRNEHLRQLSLKRYALVHTASQLRLPRPPADKMETHIKALRYFKDAQGKFDTSKYLYFQTSPKTSTGLDMTLDDFMRVIGDDLRIDHLQKLISGPGYVLPAEIRQILRQSATTWTLVTANVDCKNALSEINAGGDQIARYFEKNSSNYAIAPRVGVDYIEFPSSRFIKSVRVTEEEVRAFYDANPARFPKTLTVARPTQSHDQNYELVRANAEVLLRQQRAQSLASAAAGDFALSLNKDRILPGTQKFSELLEKNQLTLQSLPVFSMETPPAQFRRNGAALARESFALDAETRYSNPVATGQGALILVWRESIPSRSAEFSEVAEKVKNDYISEERQNQIRSLGKRIKQRVESDLKSGASFQSAITKAAASEGIGVTTRNHAPFTLRQHDARQYNSPDAGGIDRSLIETLQHLEQGRMSDMIIVSGSAGKFAYVQNVKYPDLTAANPEYVRIGQTLADRHARSTFDAYIQTLIDSELEKANNSNALSK
jgi:peptidyl-prolyl cis-trans isomerase D